MLRKIYSRVFGRRESANEIAKSHFFSRYPPTLSPRLVNKLSTIDHDHRFAYFRIGKAANSTVFATLYYALTGKQVVDLADIQRIKAESVTRLSDLVPHEVSAIEHEYFKFTFVRNPYSRILSAYLDKIARNNAPKRSMVAEKLGKPRDSEISLGDFLDYLESGGIYENGHWARQVDVLPIPHSKLNFIGRVENLADDLPFVMEQIFHEKVPVINSREHATRARDVVNEMDDLTKQRVYRLYEPDFVRLGYPRTF